MLTIPELHILLARAHDDDELAERILTVLEYAESKLADLARAGITIGQAADLAKYGHDTYLPAAANYLRYGGRHYEDLAGFREARARLGGASRWMYARQRKTFENTLKLLPLGSEIPDEAVDGMWRAVQRLESRMLANARQAKSRADAPAP